MTSIDRSTRRTASSLAAAALGGLLAIALAGCGAAATPNPVATTVASAPGAAASPAASSVASAPSAAAPATPAGNGAAFDMCSLITKADVAAAFGGDVGAGTQDNGTTCSFEIGGTAKAGKPLPGFNVPKVIVSLNPGQWLSAADQQKLFPSDKITPVAGLGEEAWYWARGLNVKRGADLFSIYLNTDFATYDAAELAADSIALAKIGYPRL